MSNFAGKISDFFLHTQENGEKVAIFSLVNAPEALLFRV